MRYTIRNYEIRLKKRIEKPPHIKYGIPIAALAASVIIAMIVMESIGTSSVAAMFTLVNRILSLSGMAEMIVRMIPLLLAGLAVYIPMRAGLWNIGAGAGIYGGGITAAAIGIYAPLPGPLLIVAILFGSAIVGGLLLFIPGYLRARWDINEILTSLLLTFGMIQLNEYAILLMPAEDVTHSSASLQAGAVFPRIAGTRIHLGVALAILAFILVYIMMNRSKFGYEIKMFGSNPTAASQAGISKYKVIIGTFVIGGILSGLAGGAEVAGIHGRLVPEFSPGYGFTAIAIALIGMRGEFKVLAATFLFAAVYIGVASIELTHAVPFALVDVFEAVVILFFVAGEAIRQFQLDVKSLNDVDDTEGVPA